jgi:activator of HSP90 ATPase
MSEMKTGLGTNGVATRRQVITSLAVTFGGLAAGAGSWAARASRPQAAPAAGRATGNSKLTALHQEVTLQAVPQRVYAAIMESKQFAAFSGLPAEIDASAGGAFSMFGGLIVGRNVELVPGQRIVQAWRPTHWQAGFYSLVNFELKPQGAETLVALEHKGFAAGDFDHLTDGWQSHYWEPLKKYFAS